MKQRIFDSFLKLFGAVPAHLARLSAILGLREYTSSLVIGVFNALIEGLRAPITRLVHGVVYKKFGIDLVGWLFDPKGCTKALLKITNGFKRFSKASLGVKCTRKLGWILGLVDGKVTVRFLLTSKPDINDPPHFWHRGRSHLASAPQKIPWDCVPRYFRVLSRLLYLLTLSQISNLLGQADAFNMDRMIWGTVLRFAFCLFWA